MNRKLRILTALLLLGLTGTSYAMSVELVPESNIINGNVNIDIDIFGLQPTLLGAFSMQLSYDKALPVDQNFNQLTTVGVSFGTFLGNPNNPNETLTGVDLSSFLAGNKTINIFEVSLLDSATLFGLQPNNSFRLATLSLSLSANALPIGSTLSFATNNIVLSDDLGNQLPTVGNSSATVTVVSEPPLPLLLVLGLVPLCYFRRRNRLPAKRAALVAGLLSFGATEAYAVPVDCSATFCEVTLGNGDLVVNNSAPGYFDDGEGFYENNGHGMTFTYNGIPQVNNQWQWFRPGGASQEYSPDDVSAFTATQDQATGTIKVVYTFDANNFLMPNAQIEIIYQLGGSGNNVTKSVQISNLSSTARDVTWIEYANTDTSFSGSGIRSQKNDFINTEITVFDSNYPSGGGLNPPNAKVMQLQSLNPGVPHTVTSQQWSYCHSGFVSHNSNNCNLLQQLYDNSITNLTNTDFFQTQANNNMDTGILGLQYNFSGVPANNGKAVVQTEYTARDSSDFIRLLGLIRDFTPANPDFQNGSYGLDLGIVAAELGTDKKPVYAGNPTTPTTTGSANFNQWYHSNGQTNPSSPLLQFLERNVSNSPNVYTYFQDQFHPIDGVLLSNGTDANGNPEPHNFNFTYEAHTQFIYGGGEILRYTSDDDLWVYINGKLAVNLGGVHSASDAQTTIHLDDMATSLGLVIGKKYNYDLFYADRSPADSLLRFDIPVIPTLGDVNFDGCVDSSDLNTLTTQVSSIMRGFPYYSAFDDINGDGVVNIADSRKLVTRFSNSGGKACFPLPY